MEEGEEMIGETIAKAITINQLRVRATVAEFGVDGLQANLDGHSKRIKEAADRGIHVPLSKVNRQEFERTLEARIDLMLSEAEFLRKCLQASGSILEEYAKTREEMNCTMNEELQ